MYTPLANRTLAPLQSREPLQSRTYTPLAQRSTKSMTFQVGEGMSSKPLSTSEILKLGLGPVRADAIDPLKARQFLAEQEVRKQTTLPKPAAEAKIPFVNKKIQFKGSDPLRDMAASLIELPERFVRSVPQFFDLLEKDGADKVLQKIEQNKTAKEEFYQVKTPFEEGLEAIKGGANPYKVAAFVGFDFAMDATIVTDIAYRGFKPLMQQIAKIPITSESMAKITFDDFMKARGAGGVDVAKWVEQNPEKYASMLRMQDLAREQKTTVDALMKRYQGLPPAEKQMTLGEWLNNQFQVLKQQQAGFAKVPFAKEEPVKPKVPTKADDLTTEARKYKSAEEFVKAIESENFIHGSRADFDKFDVGNFQSGEGMGGYGKGMSVGDNVDFIHNQYATKYGEGVGENLYLVPKKGLNIITPEKARSPEILKKLAEEIKRNPEFNKSPRAVKIADDILDDISTGKTKEPYWQEDYEIALSWDDLDIYDKLMKRIGVDGVGDLKPSVSNGIDTSQNTGITLFEPEKLSLTKTSKSQLTDIWEKANEEKIVPSEMLSSTYEPTAKTPEAFAKMEQKQEIRAIKRETMDKAKAIYDKKVAGIKDAKEILARRRQFIQAVQSQFGLSDTDLKSITRRDIRLMSNAEFHTFLDDLRVRSEKLAEQHQAYNELQAQVQEKELNIGSLREAMKLPRVSDMTTTQLREMVAVIEQYEKGDVFLSKRKLETVNRTELEGIKTYREAREILAKKLGVTPSELETIKVSELDRVRGDSSLAEQNPFYRMMIEEKNKTLLVRNAEFLKIKQEVQKLAKKLPTTFLQKLIPQQKNIAKWFDAKDKSTVTLTPEEAAVVKYMQEEWSKALEYLIEQNALKKGVNQDNYYTHIRRGVVEAVKEDGLKQAFLELLDQNKLTEQTFNILEGNTGEIMALDKFFRFAMHRTGGLKPSQNIVGAFIKYMETFKKKQALDEIVPLIDIYANSLTPKGTTSTGILLHGDLVRFTKEWLNTQKGRRISWLAKQGGKIELVLRAGKTFTTLLDLGFNIPVTLVTQVGEQVVTYQLLGKGRYLLAKARALTPQGRKIKAKYRNFIGESPWQELIAPARAINDRLAEGLFASFQDANVRRAKNFLLGSMTKEEFAAGEISAERLAALKIDMGRYGVVTDAKSIVGATPEVAMFTQYKTWALPILRTTLSNLRNLQRLFTSNKEPGKKALFELYRMAELTGIVALFWTLYGYDEDDDSFIGKLKKKAYSESFTLLQALSPSTLFTAPRTFTFVKDLAENLASIVMLEEYKESKFGDYDAGDLKGVNKLLKQLTPRAIKQFLPEQTKGLDDIKAEIKSKLESGDIDIETAKTMFSEEVKKLNAGVQKKRFELPLDEYKADLKARIENKELTVSEAKDEFIEYSEKNTDSFESTDDTSFIEKVSLYATAIGTDPVTAFHRIFTGDYIRRIDNGAIIVYRMPLEKSQEIKKRLGATKDLILDHTTPLELGGSNALSNLKLVTVEVWESYTPVENYLGDKLRAGLISKKEAQDLIKKFKQGALTAEEITQ